MKPNKRKKRRPYPAKHRKKLAELCRKNRPWEKSTGPKTAEGIEACKNNALKHGMHGAEMLELRHVLFLQRLYINALRKSLGAIRPPPAPSPLPKPPAPSKTAD